MNIRDLQSENDSIKNAPVVVEKGSALSEIKRVFTYIGYGLFAMFFGIYFWSFLPEPINKKFDRVIIRFKEENKSIEFLVSRHAGTNRSALKNRILEKDQGVIFILYPPMRPFLNAEMISEPIDFLLLDRNGRILDVKTMNPCQELCEFSPMKGVGYYVLAVKGGMARQINLTVNRVLPIPEALPLPNYEEEIRKYRERLRSS